MRHKLGLIYPAGKLKMKRKNGFTLAELLVAMIISAVLVLMVGSLSQIAFSSHEEIRKEGDIYSDIFYGLSKIRFLAHQANLLRPDTAWPAPPGSNTLFLDYSDASCASGVCECAIGLYSDGQSMKLVFIPDRRANPLAREDILEGIDATSPASFVVTQADKSVSINIQGKKMTQGNKLESFAISNFIVTRRN